MPVCTHPQCYNHVDTRGTQCANHASSTKHPTKRQFKFIHNNCLRAAEKAERACTPIPMLVTEHSDPLNDRSSVVYQAVSNSGVCGVLVVTLPRNYAFTKWLVANHLAHAYETWTGLNIPHTQSYEKLQAWFRAFYKTLSDEYPEYAKHVKYTLRED